MVGKARREPGQGRDDPDHVLVGPVPGVADPVAGGEPGEDLRGRIAADGGRSGRGPLGPDPQTPPRGPQRRAVQRRAGGGRSQVVVVHQPQVGLVGGQERQGLGGLMLADQHPDPRVTGLQAMDHRQQILPDRGGEPGDAYRAAGFRSRAQIPVGRLHRGEDRDRVLGQPASGRRQPDPAAVRFDERRAHLPREHRDLLRHRRGRGAEHVRDRPHRAQPGQFRQQFQPSRFHPALSMIPKRNINF